MENRRLRFTEDSLQYKRGFKWVTVACADIVRAYMRVEEVDAKVGRGKANFGIHFLMLKLADDTLLKLGVLPKAAVQDALKQLEQRNGNIVFGYYKEKEDRSDDDEK